MKNYNKIQDAHRQFGAGKFKGSRPCNLLGSEAKALERGYGGRLNPGRSMAHILPLSIGINWLPDVVWHFLPAAGNYNGTSLNNAGTNGNYWSSSINSSNTSNAWNLNFNSGNANTNNNNRYNGHTVRPVLSTCRFEAFFVPVQCILF